MDICPRCGALLDEELELRCPFCELFDEEPMELALIDYALAMMTDDQVEALALAACMEEKLTWNTNWTTPWTPWIPG